MGTLDVNQEIHESAVVVFVSGEVDSGNVGNLMSALDAALDKAADQLEKVLVIELNAVTYFGSAGLNAVLSCFERGMSAGIVVHIVARNAEVTRPVEVTRLDSVLHLYPTVADAVVRNADDRPNP